MFFHYQIQLTMSLTDRVIIAHRNQKCPGFSLISILNTVIYGFNPSFIFYQGCINKKVKFNNVCVQARMYSFPSILMHQADWMNLTPRSDIQIMMKVKGLTWTSKTYNINDIKCLHFIKKGKWSKPSTILVSFLGLTFIFLNMS